MRVLVAGSTGFFGRHLVEALRARGHQVRAMVRKPPEPAFPDDVELATADLDDPDSLRAACEGVDAVVSAVGPEAIPKQPALAAAAREAGARRFIPSEYGVDPHVAGPGACVVYDLKLSVQDAFGSIDTTFVYANAFATHWASGLGQVGAPEPLAKVECYGEGPQTALLDPADIAQVVAATVDDPRTANAHLTILPAGNLINQRTMIDTWTRLSGKAPEEQPVPHAELDRRIREQDGPMGGVLAQLARSVWVDGHGGTRREGVLEATELYPDLVFTPAADLLARMLEG